MSGLTRIPPSMHVEVSGPRIETQKSVDKCHLPGELGHLAPHPTEPPSSRMGRSGPCSATSHYGRGVQAG